MYENKMVAVPGGKASTSAGRCSQVSPKQGCCSSVCMHHAAPPVWKTNGTERGTTHQWPVGSVVKLSTNTKQPETMFPLKAHSSTIIVYTSSTSKRTLQRLDSNNTDSRLLHIAVVVHPRPHRYPQHPTIQMRLHTHTHHMHTVHTTTPLPRHPFPRHSIPTKQPYLRTTTPSRSVTIACISDLGDVQPRAASMAPPSATAAPLVHPPDSTVSNATAAAPPQPRGQDHVDESWQSLMRWSRWLRRRGEGLSVLQRVSKVVVFGGGSFGTAIAAALARQKPDLVVAVWLRDEAVCAAINQQHCNPRYLAVRRVSVCLWEGGVVIIPKCAEMVGSIVACVAR